MLIFITWLIVALLGFFFLLPYLRIKTSIFVSFDKENVYLLGALFWIFWPLATPALLLCFVLRPIVLFGVRMINLIEKSLEKKLESSKPEPAVNAAKSDYRHVEYDDGYSHRREY